MTSIHGAVMVLGARAVQTLVLETTVMQAYHQRLGGFDIQAFWRHAVRVASACKELARRLPDGTRPVPEDAYTAGLLHDLGQVAINDVDTVGYRDLIGASAGCEERLCALELETYGTDHAGYGAAILASWKLPAHVTATVGAHSRAESEMPAGKLPRLLRLVDRLDVALAQDTSAAPVDDEARALSDRLGLGDEALEALVAELRDARIESPA
jgi:HD-like signal output (HDOD) protein